MATMLQTDPALDDACTMCTLYGIVCAVELGAPACQSCAECGYQCEFERNIRVRVPCAGLIGNQLASSAVDGYDFVPLMFMDTSEPGSIQMLVESPRNEMAHVTLPLARSYMRFGSFENTASRSALRYDCNNTVGQHDGWLDPGRPPDESRFRRDAIARHSAVPPDLSPLADSRFLTSFANVTHGFNVNSSRAFTSNGLPAFPQIPEIAMGESFESPDTTFRQEARMRPSQLEVPQFPSEALFQCEMINCNKRGENGFQRKEDWHDHMRFKHNLQPMSPTKTKRRLDRENFRRARKFGACKRCKSSHVKCEHVNTAVINMSDAA